MMTCNELPLSIPSLADRPIVNIKAPLTTFHTSFPIVGLFPLHTEGLNCLIHRFYPNGFLFQLTAN